MESKEMSNYETWSLILTGIYDLLTFLLFAVTVYVAVIQRRIANIAFYHQRVNRDTKSWSWRRSNIDFVLENRGIDLKNVQIKSEPDNLGWRNLGDGNLQFPPKPTSEYFSKPFPYLYENEKKVFFWCDAEANKEVLEKPFKIIIEFDNPIFFYPKRRKREFIFDFSPKGIFQGVNTKYDIHNVAQEAARIRENLEKIEKHIEKISGEESKEDSEEQSI
jgi:hypothetical protein